MGLNISKPPELLALYREGLKQTGLNNCSVATQTDGNSADLKIMVRIQIDFKVIMRAAYYRFHDKA